MPWPQHEVHHNYRKTRQANIPLLGLKMEKLPQKENDKKCQCKNKTFLLSRMLGSTESLMILAYCWMPSLIR